MGAAVIVDVVIRIVAIAANMSIERGRRGSLPSHTYHRRDRYLGGHEGFVRWDGSTSTYVTYL